MEEDKTEENDENGEESDNEEDENDNDEDDNDNDSHDIVTGDVTLDRQNILKESQRKSKTNGH